MWYVTADQELTCDGCGHQIPSGQTCISDLPKRLPKKITRSEYRHFHLACPECDPMPGERVFVGQPFQSPTRLSQPALVETPKSCYQVFASQLSAERAKSEMVCLDCGHLILEGEEVVQDFFFVRDSGHKRNDAPEIGHGPAGLIAALVKGQPVKPTSFARFSPPTIRKFMRGGLGNGRGYRNFTGAREFYDASVPKMVRNLGEGAANQFVKGKQASHIESVAKAPGKAMNPRNIIWEPAKRNIKRGSRNMTRIEVIGARALNATDAVKIVGGAATKNAGKGVVWTVLFEFPVSLAENGICVFRGKKTHKAAAKDTGKDLATAGAAGGIIAAGTTVAVAMGAGPALTVAAPVLVPVGVGIFAISSGSRIWRAWKDGLTKLELNFHANCPDCETETSCYASFADWVSSYPAAESSAEESEEKKDA